MSVALKPKPMLAGAADAGAASRSTAAAGTSAMTFIFIFQVLPCCHRESVAHTAGDAAPAAPAKSAAEHQARASVQTARRTPTQAVRAAVGTAARSPFRCEHPTARRRPRHRTMHQCRVPGKPYFLPATLLGHSEAVGYQMVVSLVGPRDPPDRGARTSLVSDVDLLSRSQDAREERFHGEDAQAGDPNRWTQPRGREPRTHDLARRTPGLLDHPDDPTGSVWSRLTDEAFNVSRLYPSGAVQVDVEHPARNRKVEGSNLSSGFKAPGQWPACFAWSFPPARWPLSPGPTTILWVLHPAAEPARSASAPDRRGDHCSQEVAGGMDVHFVSNDGIEQHPVGALE